MVVIIPMCFQHVWLSEYFMDKIVRAGQMAECQSVKRSEVWHHHNDQMDRVEQQWTELQVMLGERK
jgi:hypothetical protein